MSSVTRTIFYRELWSGLFSMVRYLMYAAFYLISSAIFISSLVVGETASWSFANLWTFSVAFPLPILISLITMPVVAGERSAGMYEALELLPVPLRKIIVGKFAATYIMVLIALLFSTISWFTLSHAVGGENGSWSSWRPIGGACIVLALHAFSWTALGTLCSSITRRPWTAGMLTLVGGCAIILLWVVFSKKILGSIDVYAFPLFQELVNGANGIVSLNSFVLHISFGLCALLLAAQVLEARR